MAGNRLSDLASIVEDLDATGRLVRVRSEVDPHLELAGVAARFEGGPRAVLFENVKGHDAPVLTGLYWSRDPPLKMVTVVDDDVDIRDAKDVEWAMATRFDPAHGIIRIDNVFGHGLNPGFPDYLGTKVGFDACRPFPHTPEYDRAAYDSVEQHAGSIEAVRDGPGDRPDEEVGTEVEREGEPDPVDGCDKAHIFGEHERERLPPKERSIRR